MKPSILVASSFLLSAPAWATAIPVPEPGTLTLAGAAAVAGVLLYRSRRGR